MDKVKEDYQKLKTKYEEERKQIDSLDELYIKFKNLKEYEQEYDRNQELKKQLEYWSKGQKTTVEVELEQKIAMLSQYLSVAREKTSKPQPPQRMHSLNH